MQDAQLKLEQEKDDLEHTIKELMHRLYGRRSERQVFSADQLCLDFGEGDPVEVLPDVTPDEEFVVEYEKKKRRRKRKKYSGRFPDHLERRTECIEPVLPDGIRPEDCEQIEVDIVAILVAVVNRRGLKFLSDRSR
jgi:hypothetical protein